MSIRLFASLVLATMPAATGDSFITPRLRGIYPQVPPILSKARNDFPPERRTQLTSLSEKQSVFVSECTSFLLSPESTEDGIVSQDEYSSFLLSQCRIEGLCGEDMGLGFEQLSIGLQLKFVRGVCPFDGLEERINCIEDLEAMWLQTGEFGFLLSETGLFAVNELVNDMCVGAYSDVVEMGLTTRASEPTFDTSANEYLTPATNQPSIAQTTRQSHPPSSQPSSLVISNVALPTLSPTLGRPEPTSDPITVKTINPSSNSTSLPSSAQTTSQLYPPNSQSSGPVISNLTITTLSPTLETTSSPTSERHASAEPTSVPIVVKTINPSSSATNLPSSAQTTNQSFLPSSQPIRPFILTVPVPTPLPTAVPAGSLSSENSSPVKANGSPIFKATDSPSLQPNLFTRPTSFVEQCIESLLSTEVQQDGTVSQIEFVDFLTRRCKNEGLCDDTFSMEFEELDVSLQLDFILIACRDNDCNDLDTFGIIANDVEELCSGAFAYALSRGMATTIAPTANPSNAPTRLSSHEKMPLPTYDMPNESPSIDPDSKSRKALVGLSAAVAVLFMAVGGVMAYRRSALILKKSAPDDKDSNRFSAALYERNYEFLSPPFPFSYPSSSSSSSSSSFRDCRFVPVFGPDGRAIIQFNPNTANAVVIGSVTIGGSSSISTGPFVKDEKSSSNYILIGQVNQAKSEASGNSSELSSLSSGRSASISGKSRRRSKLFGSSGKKRLDSSFTSESIISKSVISRSTMPMTSTKLERRRFDTQVSFADWKAAGDLISQQRNTGAATDTYAMQRQSKFFFDVFTTPVSDDSSDESRKHPSFRSLNINLLIPSVKSESDKSIGSAPMGNNYDKSSSKVPAGEVLVPWRRSGFSASFQSSDCGPEGSECSKSFYIHQLPKPPVASKQDSVLLMRPLRNYLRSMKAGVNGWFKKKHYQDLRLHEDPSVISMRSYSSNIQLLPGVPDAPVFGLPGLILGTFAAAASRPVEQKRSSLSHPKKKDVEAGLISVDHLNKSGKVESTASHIATTNDASHTMPPTLGIERRDDDASFSSDSESSTGWSSSSMKHSSLVSSCTSASMYESASAISTDKAAPTDTLAKHVSVQLMNAISQTLSESESTNESVGSNEEDAKLNSSNPSKTGKEDNTSVNVVSDASGSFNSEEVPLNVKTSETHRDKSNAGNLSEESMVISHATQKAHDKNFFMMLAGDILADASSADDSTDVDNEDWSHNVSDSTSTSSSCDTDGSAFNTHSLSLSLESGADSASQAIDWAITREASKQFDSSFNDCIISVSDE